MGAQKTELTGVNKVVIGKIPGYNDNIVGDPGGIQYTNRLLNNLTMIRMRPTGYSMDFSGILDDLGKAVDAVEYALFPNAFESVPKGTNSTFVYGPTAKLGTDSLAKELTGSKTDSSFLSSTTAASIWKEILNGNFEKGQASIRESNELNILITNDSTVSEMMSNNFEKSTIDRLSDSVANSKLGYLNNLKKATTVDTALGMQLLSTGTDSGSGALSILAAKSLGIQSNLPKEWRSSEYTQTLQVQVKLISPSGHPDDIKAFIEDPLKLLMLSAAPISFDGMSFGFPMIWEIEADGLMDMKLAAVTSMTITRGGTETQFNRFNQPLNVDVRLSIEPLVSGFATSFDSSKYDQFLLSNPQQLSKSLSPDETDAAAYTAIVL